MDNLDLIINLIIIGLLIPTILYAYRLNKNLEILRQNQSSLARLVESLNDATIKAENSIPKLKTATQNTSGELKEVVNSAKNLKDDLMFINKRADTLADRLENVIHNGRKLETVSPTNTEDEKQSSEKTETNRNENEKARSEAEMELLKALRSIK